MSENIDNSNTNTPDIDVLEQKISKLLDEKLSMLMKQNETKTDQKIEQNITQPSAFDLAKKELETARNKEEYKIQIENEYKEYKDISESVKSLGELYNRAVEKLDVEGYSDLEKSNRLIVESLKHFLSDKSNHSLVPAIYKKNIDKFLNESDDFNRIKNASQYKDMLLLAIDNYNRSYKNDRINKSISANTNFVNYLKKFTKNRELLSHIPNMYNDNLHKML